MQLSFYDASIMCYEQILQSTTNVLKAGREHAEANDMPLSDNLVTLSSTHEIQNLAFFDQFPYTHHLESGVVLTKKIA